MVMGLIDIRVLEQYAGEGCSLEEQLFMGKEKRFSEILLAH